MREPLIVQPNSHLWSGKARPHTTCGRTLGIVNALRQYSERKSVEDDVVGAHQEEHRRDEPSLPVPVLCNQPYADQRLRSVKRAAAFCASGPRELAWHNATQQHARLANAKWILCCQYTKSRRGRSAVSSSPVL
jgi:hypothetical protein